jgi:hypothetical protein
MKHPSPLFPRRAEATRGAVRELIETGAMRLIEASRLQNAPESDSSLDIDYSYDYLSQDRSDQEIVRDYMSTWQNLMIGSVQSSLHALEVDDLSNSHQHPYELINHWWNLSLRWWITSGIAWRLEQPGTRGQWFRGLFFLGMWWSLDIGKGDRDIPRFIERGDPEGDCRWPKKLNGSKGIHEWWETKY